LDLISFLAKRHEPARLLLIGTYRLAEAIADGHPLHPITQELLVHRQCKQLPLGLLSEEKVGEYLEVRFAAEGGVRRAVPLRQLARVIHQRTDGNPLFMVTVVDYLTAHGVDPGQLASSPSFETIPIEVPETIQRLIEKQFTRLGPEVRRVLEVASVVGVEFSAAAVAAGLDADIVQVEEWCGELVRHEQFLRMRAVDEWPDGTVATRYGFIHSLYQQILYQGVTGARRARLHQRIGEWTETAYGNQAGEKAAELAVHFGQGRDYQRAVQYLRQAAETANRRHAFQEALGHATAGLKVLKHWPDTAERSQQELLLLLSSIGPIMALRGEAAPELEHAYAHIQELQQQLGEIFPSFWILAWLWSFRFTKGELQAAYDLGLQLLALAQEREEPQFSMWAHHALGAVLLFRGELTAARAHFEQMSVAYNVQQPQLYLADPQMLNLSFSALILWLCGYPDQALQKSQEALEVAKKLLQPYGLAHAFTYAAWLHIHRGEELAVREKAEELFALAEEHGFTPFQAGATLLHGWALLAQGGAAEGASQIWQGIESVRATGTGLTVPGWLIICAGAREGMRQAEEGLAVLAEAKTTMDRSGESILAAELYRVKGELTLKQFGVRSSEFGVSTPQPLTPSTQSEAEGCFREAIEIARHQGAKSLELRAVMSLSRLWQQQGKTAKARALLAKLYAWFTEGFETADLKAAKALLEELTLPRAAPEMVSK
jgi:tetratricopeptide (TPR) repeat protein